MMRLVLLCHLHQRRLPGRLLPPGRPHRHLFNRPQAGVLVRTTAAKTLSTGRRRHHQHRVLHHPPVLHLRLHGRLLMILGRGLFKHGPCLVRSVHPRCSAGILRCLATRPSAAYWCSRGSQPPTAGQCLSRRPDVCSLWSLQHRRRRLLHTSAGPAPDATPTTAGQCLLHSPAGPTAFTIVSAGTASDATLTCDAELGSSCLSPGHE